MGRPNQLVRQVTVANEFGIHARPAAKISQIAQSAKENVWILYGDEKVDATSIIDILSLCCVAGSDLVIEIETLEDTDILDMIATFFKSGFGETDGE